MLFFSHSFVLFRLFPKVIYLIQSNTAVSFVEFQATTHLFTKCIELHAYTRFIVYSTEFRCNDCVRQLLVLHTFLFFRSVFLLQIVITIITLHGYKCTGCELHGTLLIKTKARIRSRSYHKIFIHRTSLLLFVRSLLFVILLKFSRLYIVINMHRIHKRDCCCC